MEQQYIFNQKSLSFFDKGKGPVIFLLHGYLETKEVWNDFADMLSINFRVIALDIPGHGKSDMLAHTHTMRIMAESTNALLEELEIETCTMVGHSMGGYVMLAFADLFSEKLERFVLFHSSVYADTDEKKHNRQREIKFIENGKLELIINTNLPNTFATQNLTAFSNEIKRLKKFANGHNPDGVCALLRGMKERPDRQKLIQEFTKPMLFIFGEHDNYISCEAAEKMTFLNKKIIVKWLKNSGHMGFIEEKNNAYNAICKFIDPH